jgi:hypothetical protein
VECNCLQLIELCTEDDNETGVHHLIMLCHDEHLLNVLVGFQANKDGVRKTVYFPSGEHYTGSWKNNLRHGKGVLIYRNGAKYEGDWYQGLRQGLGTLWAYENGKYKVKYNGGWHADVPTGRGMYYDPDGNTYEGEWVDGRRGGHGKMCYGAAARGHVGVVYEGQWKDDIRHGRGTMTYANGNVYEGHWESDVRSGMGTLFMNDKGMRFDGKWAGDAPKAGTYTSLQPQSPGLPGALPVLELQDAKKVLQEALASS